MSQIPVFVNRIFNLHSIRIFKKVQIQCSIPRTFLTSPILAKKVSFTLSDIGEGIREVLVKEWFVKVGDKVSQFDNICEVQSDKASVTITSRYDGVITKLYYQVDDTALVGQPLVEIDTDEKTDENIVDQKQELEKSVLAENNVQISEAVIELHTPEDISSSSSSSSDENTVLCIPSVRRLAKQHSIDLTKVKGTGKNGRILKEDILEYMEKPAAKTPEKVPEGISQSTVSFGKDDVKIEPIKGFTKAMVKTMTAALKIPHFVFSDEIKVTKLSQLRKELKNLPELKDTKITFMPFFIKATSNALQRYPIINASVDEKCENIIYHKHHNIGVAMATSQGLAVPVIKNVESLTVLEIAKQLNKLIESGKNGNFSTSDLSGATFSVSNIGMVGGTYAKPVILPPQVAIYAIGMTQVLPRFDDTGNVVAEEIMTISGSADHRILDGVTMASFIKTIKKQIENPSLLFLNL